MKITKSQVFSRSFKHNSQQLTTKCQLYEVHWYQLKIRDAGGIIPSFPHSVLQYFFSSPFLNAHNYLPLILFQEEWKHGTNATFLLGFWNSSLVSHDISSDTTSSDKPYSATEDCNAPVSFCSSDSGHKNCFQIPWITAVRKYCSSSLATSMGT